MRSGDRGRLLDRGRVLSAAGRNTSLIVGATGRLLDPGNPLYYAETLGVILWLRADMGITLGGTLKAQGTSAPAWTLSGTSTTQVAPHFAIDSVAGGTALGQATYKWSMDGGSTYVATGVTTATGPTALGTTGLLVAQAVGPYNIDNTWDATVSAWADQSGNANHATQAIASRQPVFSLSGFNGFSCLDYGSVGSGLGLATPSVTFGVHTLMAAVRGDANSGTIIEAANDAGNASLFCGSNGSTVSRGGLASIRNPGGSWVRDAVRRTVGRTYGGTHAKHLVYVQGVDAAAPENPSFTNDGGTTPAAGVIRIGGLGATFTTCLRGVLREVIVLGDNAPPSVMLSLHRGMAARAAGAI